MIRPSCCPVGRGKDNSRVQGPDHPVREPAPQAHRQRQVSVILDEARPSGGDGALAHGEQQMLPIARALLARRQLLVMDEPSMGVLAPLRRRDPGPQRTRIGILLVEQDANMALAIAHRGYVLQTGRIVFHDTVRNLSNRPLLRKAYLEL